MKPNFLFPALLPLLLTLPAAADKFTLKDGSTVEGTIISEADGVYTINAVVGKGIKDERKVPTADVVKQEKEEADEKAFKPLAKLVPAPDLLTTEEYNQYCLALDAFIKAYPTSSKTKEAKAMLQTLKDEFAEVAAGALKLNGKMIKKSEYATNAYDYDARVQEMKIRNLYNKGQTLAALRAFSAFEHDFRSTRSYTSLAPTMGQAMQAYLEETRQLQATFEARTKQRQTGLARMSPADRRATENAINEENAAVEACYKAEKSANEVWFTAGPYNKASMDDAVRSGAAELARISAAKPVLGVDGGQAYHSAWELIHNGGAPAAVATAITAAKTAGVAPRYITTLEAEAKAMAAESKNKPK